MSVHEATSRENNPEYGEDSDIDVDTALTVSISKPTPLPKLQISIIFLTLFSEPITAMVIYPFINQFVRETGVTQGDENKTGYYAGIVESAFFMAKGSTVVQWGYLSDRFGRRPVLLLGPLGMAFSIFVFGTSTTYTPLVISRFCQGVFNACLGVSQSMLAEMTDASNIGDAFALEPLVGSIASTISPIIGGVLSSPATRWPDTLGRLQFLQVHPYFLPCVVSSSIALVAFIIATLALKETLPSLVTKRRTESLERMASRDVADETIALINHRDSLDYDPTLIQIQSSSSESTPIQQGKPPLLNRGLVMIYLNNAFLAFLQMGHFSLLPLFYSTSIPSGGLGLDPSKIGIVMGAYGFVNAIVQATFLGSLIRKFGARKLYIICFPALLGCYALYPIMRHLVQRSGRVNHLVIFCMIVQLSFQVVTYPSSGSMNIVLVQHVSESGHMGTAIGIAQMSTSVMGSIAPALASALFSISLERQLAGGDMVFYLLMGLSVLAMRLSYLLPPRVVAKSRPS